MTRYLAVAASLVCLALLGVAPRALAQGLPTPGPGGAPASDGGTLILPLLVVGVILFGALVLAVGIADVRRKRRVHAIGIEGQISDALMREARLGGAILTPVAHVPLRARAAPVVEIRGQVEYPELREVAVRIVRQELLRHHPEGRVEDRIFVSPPVVADRR